MSSRSVMAGVYAVVFACTLGVVSCATQQVMIGTNGGLVFEPASVTVSSGDTVDFVMDASFNGISHNVVFQTAPSSTVDLGSISSGTLDAAGQSWPVTLTAAGLYTYVCTFHQSSGMVGNITVTASPTVPGTNGTGVPPPAANVPVAPPPAVTSPAPTSSPPPPPTTSSSYNSVAVAHGATALALCGAVLFGLLAL